MTSAERNDDYVLEANGETRAYRRITVVATGERRAVRGKAIAAGPESNVARYLAAKHALDVCTTSSE